MAGSNVHLYLENSELHNPKDFSLASNATALTKNNNGELEWLFQFLQEPILSQTDGSLAPPTTNDGDRYVLVGTTSVSSSWDGATVNDIVQYFASDALWQSVSPLEGTRLYDKNLNNMLTYNGSAWVQDTNGSADGVIKRLAAYDSVDLTSIGNTTLYTNASGKNTFITKIVLRADNFNSVTGTPTVSFFIDGAEDVIAQTVLTGFDNASEDEYYIFNVDAVVRKLKASQTLKIAVDSAATATDMDVIVDVFGYEITT